jgi:hypothetical protein
MIKKLWSFICEHGYAIMLAGMVIVAAACIVLFRSRQADSQLGSFVWPIAIVGLAVYILGRIGAAMKNKAGKRREASADTSS